MARRDEVPAAGRPGEGGQPPPPKIPKSRGAAGRGAPGPGVPLPNAHLVRLRPRQSGSQPPSEACCPGAGGRGRWQPPPACLETYTFYSVE